MYSALRPKSKLFIRFAPPPINGSATKSVRHQASVPLYLPGGPLGSHLDPRLRGHVADRRPLVPIQRAPIEAAGAPRLRPRAPAAPERGTADCTFKPMR